MGRKPLPQEIKRARGTLRADRMPSNGVSLSGANGSPPEPPESLGELGRAVWSRVLVEAGAWVNYRLDTLLLRIVCEQLDEREQLRALVIEYPEQARLRIGLRELDKAIISGLSSLGLTPADRARLGVGAAPAVVSKLDAITLKHYGKTFAEYKGSGSGFGAG
jgi:hypothetical protein